MLGHLMCSDTIMEKCFPFCRKVLFGTCSVIVYLALGKGVNWSVTVLGAKAFSQSISERINITHILGVLYHSYIPVHNVIRPLVLYYTVVLMIELHEKLKWHIWEEKGKHSRRKIWWQATFICTVIDCRLSLYVSDRNQNSLLVQHEACHCVDITFKNCITCLHLIFCKVLFVSCIVNLWSSGEVHEIPVFYKGSVGLVSPEFPVCTHWANKTVGLLRNYFWKITIPSNKRLPTK